MAFPPIFSAPVPTEIAPVTALDEISAPFL
jgi:hypothetical protein